MLDKLNGSKSNFIAVCCYPVFKKKTFFFFYQITFEMCKYSVKILNKCKY